MNTPPHTVEILSEGITGILDYRDEAGRSQTYIPFYDLDAARELLLEFQELKDVSGVALKDNYIVNGRDWFPSVVSWLYWHFFFNYVKYQSLIDPFFGNKTRLHVECDGEFSRFLRILRGPEMPNRWKQKALHSLIGLQNRLALRNHRYQVMFYRFSREDFRSIEICSALKKVVNNYIEALPCPNFKQAIISLKNKEAVYYYGSVPCKNQFSFEYALNNLSDVKRNLFSAAANSIGAAISGYIRECRIHKQCLSNSSVKTFYGFDDVNGYCMPLLLACKDHGIKTVAHQHGAYVKRHAGYIMEGIDPDRFEWFDNLIVWGQYWKDKLQRDSKAHAKRHITVGANKFHWDYSTSKGVVKGRKNVLIPYEFLTNTHLVGKYISALIAGGYHIFFKPRADDNPVNQLRTYCLSNEDIRSITVIETLNTQAISNIDIIAATMTTLVYELLPYNKIVWILDSEYKHLYDLVEEGYAHKITLSELPMPSYEKWEPSRMNEEELFSKEELFTTLTRCVSL